MNENPLVSIVIPVYNGSNFLKEAIDNNLTKPTPVVPNRTGSSNFQGSIFDDDSWYKRRDPDKTIWDPYLDEWISREDYYLTYGIHYTGQFNSMQPDKKNKHNKKGKDRY